MKPPYIKKLCILLSMDDFKILLFKNTFVSVRTVSRFVNSQNYYYLQTRRKVLMTAEDHIKRVKFANTQKATTARTFGQKKFPFTWIGQELPSKEIH